MWSPCLAHVRADGYVDVVEVRGRSLLQARDAARPYCVDVVREGICDELALVVVEGRVSSNTVLSRDRVCYAVEGEAVIVRTLYVDQGARSRVMIGNVDMWPVRGYPLTVGLCRIDNLAGAVREVIRRVSIRAG